MKIYLKILALSATTSALYAQDRPNILWLTFEDTSPDFIGCYGNKQAKTPNIDKLAEAGVRFRSAYSTGAVSAPSRYCLITGTHANTMGTGNHRSKYGIPDEIKGFPYHLRQTGYYTSNNSKTDYNTSSAETIIREAWDDSSNKAGWWNRKPGQPFFSVYNSVASHQSRTMTNSWSQYEKQVLTRLTDQEKIKDTNLTIPVFFRNSAEMQKNVSRVYNSIALMDKEFGNWMAQLEKEGLKDSTIIFCFSDHGQGISRAKGSATTTGYQVPFIVWIPPMYKHLSPWGDGVVSDELVSFEDLAPTILHLAGVPIPEYMKGRVFMGKKPAIRKKYVFSGLDRTDESSELSRTVTDGRYQYTRVFLPFQPFVRWNMYYDVSDLQKTIRNDFKNGRLNSIQSEILKPRLPEYLYDTHTDKWGVKNLMDDPALKQKLAELRNALLKNIITTRDPHFMTEYIFQTENNIPVVLASDSQKYPIEEILDAACLSGKGKKAIAHQIRYLQHKNQFVRYWAAVGLFSQQAKLNNPLKELEQLRDKESFAPTRNVLTTVLFKQNDEEYLSDIKELIREENPELLRMSLNLLITIPDNQQKLLLDDIKSRFESNLKKKEKGMFYCNEYFRLFLHKLENLSISADDSF